MDLEKLIAENQALKAKLTARRAAQRQNYVPRPLDLSEYATRKIYIDAMLLVAGWIEGRDWLNEVELSGMPNAGGVGYADYVLYDDAHRPLAVVEAKRVFVNLLPDLSITNLCEEKDNDAAHCVFSTYQTMMNRIDTARDREGKVFTCGHFDLVICDESHRQPDGSAERRLHAEGADRLQVPASPSSTSDMIPISTTRSCPSSGKSRPSLTRAASWRFLPI